MNHEIEPQAAARVGQLVFYFARLDFLLALAIRNLLAAPNFEDVDPLIERLGFKDKLDALLEIVGSKRSDRAVAANEYEAWYAKADKLRATRNAFVHGRWGLQTRDTVFNTSPKFVKAIAGSAKIFSLADLDQEVLDAKAVLEAFYEWHSRHVVNAA